MLLLSFKTDKYIFRLEQLGFKWVLGPNQWFYYFKCNGYNCFPFVVNTELLHDMHIHKLFKKFTLWHIPEHTEHYMILPNHSADFLFFSFSKRFEIFFIIWSVCTNMIVIQLSITLSAVKLKWIYDTDI